MITVDRAITLTQPWATLWAIGAKLIETRSRATHYRGWVAIHAAKSYPTECLVLCHNQPHFFNALVKAGIENFDQLPVGKIIGVANITDCKHARVIRDLLSPQELEFGDYADGRFAYLSQGPRLLREPIPMNGCQAIPWRMPRTITEADLV